MPLQQATRQHGKARENFSGTEAGDLGPQRGPALAQQWWPSGFKPRWAAEPLSKHPATSQPARGCKPARVAD